MIISNCVINLSADKDRVLREAFRVLKRAGASRCPTWWCAARCPSDPPQHGPVDRLRGRRAARCGLPRQAASGGFEDAAIEVTRVYSAEDAKEFLAGQPEHLQQLAREVDGRFVSGFVRTQSL